MRSMFKPGRTGEDWTGCHFHASGKGLDYVSVEAHPLTRFTSSSSMASIAHPTLPNLLCPLLRIPFYPPHILHVIDSTGQDTTARENITLSLCDLGRRCLAYWDINDSIILSPRRSHEELFFLLRPSCLHAPGAVQSVSHDICIHATL